jgi:hypothetical protein
VKRTGRGEETGAVIHIYMGTAQGNSLLSQTSKNVTFPILYSIFFFYKIKEQCGGGDGTGGKREVAGKGGGRMNMVQTLNTHVCKYKNDVC